MKTGKKIRYVIISWILLCAGAYLGIAFYYMEGFSFGTWINGVYCTGKNVEEVNAELLSLTAEPGLEVIYPICCGEEKPEGERGSSHFVLDERMAEQDYTKGLRELLQNQRPLMWVKNLFLQKGGYELEPAVILTEEGKEQFKKEFLADERVQAELDREACIRLLKDGEEGFLLYDGKKRRLDVERALTECLEAVEKGKESIVLSSACYYDEEISPEEKGQEALYRELKDFIDFEIVYDMGAEQVRFDQKALADLLMLEDAGEENAPLIRERDGRESVPVRGEDGSFCWDQEKVEAAIGKLAAAYDTYGRPREFMMTGGGSITLEKGNYGTELDKKAEVKWLSEALAKRCSETHTPAYRREAYARGENDIGDTYIEINMTKQKLWFYQAGEVEIETPIVTGNMMRRRATPEGVYFVYGKQKNRILRGPGYASHVNYWMPVKGGVGIHDALWRDEFGGEIYKKEGSHGCINLPLEAAEKLYGMIEIGVPVVMYYEEEDK